MEDLFDLENNPKEVIEKLKEQNAVESEEEDKDLYSDVLDQIDEIAIKVENLKTRVTKRRKSPSKEMRSIVRRILYQQKREQERNQQRKTSK